jgi:hypothetical protein
VTFNIEVVLKGRDFAVTQAVTVPHGHPASWDDSAVRDVLTQILRTIDRVENPESADDHTVVLRGFSWIVEPVEEQVVIAIEIPMGAAVAGPFAIGAAQLDSMIARVLKSEHQPISSGTIH